ncbi:hypothetical protein F511_01004 [Dorcoceras hygrometricum]|uniref:TLDc domain-containing protein n=1 Tax=Dorcoceras hygrometricum TaxID=472368 RepID=A0A2Z7AEF4_9LAMI|nr:hypothetical protein F511_01004 [Dorcoceras hygrometricum]
MGQSSSREQEESPELREVQSLVASTGALPRLQKAFSRLSDAQTKSIPLHSLKKCFELDFDDFESDHTVASKELSIMFGHLGSAIVDFFFPSDENGVSWIDFLRGYSKCCGRTVASTYLNNLLQIFSKTCSEAGFPVNLQFEQYDDDCKVGGSLLPREVLRLLLICWIFSWDSRTLKLNMGKSKWGCSLPDISPLVLSAVESCIESGDQGDFWNSDVSKLDIQLMATKIHSWALQTIPNLADCLAQFLHSRLCYLVTRENKSESSCSSAQDNPSSTSSETSLLTSGRAWAISLTVRGPVYEQISKACFPSDDPDENNENLLYRSSLDGKGLNRFWSNVEGYNGPLLMLISACEDANRAGSWIIGALTNQGFENKETFYGNSGSLYTLSPVFQSLTSSGREKNLVYSHLHPTGRMYDAHPKPVGIAFGGSTGNERIFMDDDFARVTIRHHAVDKTYQHGTLLPDQGFLPVEATVFEVEVWGLGGATARGIQDSYKKRENLFTQQRRKVDLKTFANWEDSPEKLMMDMMSNPHAVRREER